jgi:hypothetical protein
MNQKAAERILLCMGKVHNLVEIWQGSQNLCAKTM